MTARALRNLGQTGIGSRHTVIPSSFWRCHVFGVHDRPTNRILQTHYNRQNSFTPSRNSWWRNPFGGSSPSSSSSVGGGAQLGSARSRGGEEVETPRRIQERKDVILVLLALEFRRISMEQSSKSMDREKIVDLAFESLEEKDLDSKTILQLRH